MTDVSKITDSRNDDAKALLKLATARFGKLTPAEEKLFRNTAMGEVADFSWCTSNEPTDAEDWHEPCVLRADRIAWLCADRKAREYITHSGLVILGARIEGFLDLQAVRFPYLFGLLECSIADETILLDSLFLALNLSGSHTGPINADRMKVEGSVFLRNGFRATGEVRLFGATIGGDLDCEHGSFINPVTQTNPDGNALSADRMKVEGSVFLRNGFRAEGEVRLLGATIGGNLDCNKGTFINNSDGYALSADRMKVEGSVFLRNGFRAEGEVRLLGATIGGNLDCNKGTFINNSDGYALSADGMKVEGSVFLSDGFRAEGILSFVAVTIRRHFQLIEVDEKSDFQLDLWDAHIGVLWDQPASWPKKGKLSLHGLVYDDIRVFASDGASFAMSDAKTRIKWLELQGDEKYYPQPYEQLAAVLKKNGHVMDARKVLIAKEKFRKAKGKLSWSERWLWYKTLGPMIGYGYRPLWAFLYAMIFIAVGACLFWDGQELLAPTGGKPTAAESGEDGFPYPSFNAIVYSLDTFVPIVDFHQVKYRLPNAQMVPKADKEVWQVRSGSLLLTWFWIEVGAGWVISSLLVVGLTRFVRS